MKKFVYLSLLVSVFITDLKGSPISPDSIAIGKSITFYDNLSLINLWSLGNNPAGFNFYPINAISQAQMGYNRSIEKMHWAQSPEIIEKFYIQTTGLKRVKKFIFNGQFEYNNSHYGDLMYNNTLEFDNKNLYIIGDTINGKQKKEGFSMSGGTSFSITENLTVGFNANYETYQGAKVRDPRNLNKISALTLTPGLIFHFKSTYIGMCGGAIWKNNDIDIDVWVDSKHNLFQFLGMGYYEAERNISSYSVLYENNGYFSSVQYNIKKEGWQLFQSLTYTSLSNKARKGSSFRLLDGTSDLDRIEYINSLLLKKGKAYHQVNVNISNEKINGTEIEQHTESILSQYYSKDSIVTDRWIKDKHITQDLFGKLEYRLSGLGSSVPFKYHLTAGIDARYYKAWHYPVADYGYYKTFTICGYLNYQQWFHLPFADFAPTLGIAYRKSLVNEINYNIIKEKSFAEIPENDYQYLSSDYYMTEINLTILKPMNLKFLKEYFFNVKSSYLYIPNLATSKKFNFMLQVSTGITF